LALVLICVIVLAVGVAVGRQLWTGRQAKSQADEAGASYFSSCNFDQAGQVPDGTIIGTLQLPGDATTWPIRAGTDEAALTAGVGWFSQTALPGQLGNMAVIGRRLITGGAFDAILDLKVGDQVVVHTCESQYTYTIFVAPSDLTVQRSDGWVLDPTPGSSGQLPTQAILTLIANQDIIGSSDLAVGFAKLTGTS